MTKSDQLYENVVSVTQTYLGPAADRFITRQIRNHLRKAPERLVKKDLADLIDWIRVAMGFLTEDHELIDEYIKNLEGLARKQER
jgi:hypothetical protein